MKIRPILILALLLSGCSTTRLSTWIQDRAGVAIGSRLSAIPAGYKATATCDSQLSLSDCLLESRTGIQLVVFDKVVQGILVPTSAVDEHYKLDGAGTFSMLAKHLQREGFKCFTKSNSCIGMLDSGQQIEVRLERQRTGSSIGLFLVPPPV
jgi:hypothetical protein